MIISFSGVNPVTKRRSWRVGRRSGGLFVGFWGVLVSRRMGRGENERETRASGPAAGSRMLRETKRMGDRGAHRGLGHDRFAARSAEGPLLSFPSHQRGSRIRKARAGARIGQSHGPERDAEERALSGHGP